MGREPFVGEQLAAFMWGCGKVPGQPLTASQRPGLSQPAGRPLEDTAPQQRWGQGPRHRILPAKPQTPSPWARKGPRSGETLGSDPLLPAPRCPAAQTRNWPPMPCGLSGSPRPPRPSGGPGPPALWDVVSGRACLGLTALPPSLMGLHPQLGRLARVQPSLGGPRGARMGRAHRGPSSYLAPATHSRAGPSPRTPSEFREGGRTGPCHPAGGRPGPSCLMRSHSPRCTLAPEPRLSLLH